MAIFILSTSRVCVLKSAQSLLASPLAAIYFIMDNHDERVLVYLVDIISNAALFDKPEFFGVFEALCPLQDLWKYLSLSNIAYCLLCFGSPLQLSIDDIVDILQRVNSKSNSGESKQIADTKPIADYLSTKTTVSFTMEAAESIRRQIDLQLDNHQDLHASEFDTLLLNVVKSRLRINSIYLDNVSLSDHVIHALDNHQQFREWYRGGYGPYKYYWDNYGMFNDSLKYSSYLTLSKQQAFEALVLPMTGNYSNKFQPQNWLNQVIVPFLKWHDDFEPLNAWLFNQDNLSHRNYSLWHVAIRSLIDHEIGIDNYRDIIRNFIAFCYYDKHMEKPLEMLNNFDTIKETTLMLIPILPKDELGGKQISYKDGDLGDFSVFIEQASLNSLFQANKQNIIILSEMIECCIKLYPINKMSVNHFLKWKYGECDIDDFKREVSRMLVGITPKNCKLLINSVDLFKLVFIGESNEINELIIDRFLFHNMFELIEEKINQGKLDVTYDTLHRLLLNKFWDSVHQAEKLDSSELGYAQKCLDLFDKFCSEQAIIQLKHLVKVFNNVKNFRLQVNHKSISPSEILKRFGTLPSIEELRTEMESVSPMGLITMILEQNPKSYLAFEKLFKILNDFLMFLNDDLQSNYYFNRLMSACMESSLIDGNFQYAYTKALELLDKGQNDNLSDMWLTFYQLGKYQTPELYESPKNPNNLVLLIKQNEILSKFLKVINRNDVLVDNSRLILQLWETINHRIQDIFVPEDRINDTDHIAHGPNNTESLSNLFVSGLGWAIGANQR